MGCHRAAPPPPMTAEQALRQAEAEGLTLLRSERSDTSTGYNRVTVDSRSVVSDAGIPAKRKAALVVAALLRACVPGEVRSRADVQDVIRGVIGAYL